MKQSLQSKQKLAIRLSGYAVSAGALMAIGSTANAQVIYSGLQNIDVDLPETYLEIDINGDMVNDFGFFGNSYYYLSTYGTFFVRTDIGYGIIINPKTDSYNNSWITKYVTVTLGPTYSVYYYQGMEVDGLELGEIIDSMRSQWSNFNSIGWPGALGVSYNFTYYGPYYAYYNNWYEGEFLGEEKYIGIHFYIGSEQHYGWIRLSMGENVDPITIIDWAYEATPDAAILAGDGLGVTLPPYLRITGGGGASTDPDKVLTISANNEINGLELNDILVTNGTADNLTEVTPGYEYTVEITATAEGNVVVEIPASAVTFTSGGDNLAVSSGWHYDITSPEVYLYPDVYNMTNDAIVEVDVEFNERVNGFEAGDIFVTNGSVTDFGMYYNYEYYWFEVTASSDGLVSVEIPAGAVTDLAGNPNEVESDSWIYDGTPPVAMFSGVSGSTTDAIVNLSVNFEETVDDLYVYDFYCTNCNAVDLTELTYGRQYNLEVEALDYGTVTVELPPWSVFDQASNTNLTSSISWQYIYVNALEEQNSNGISIYPNPVNGNLHIELENESMLRIVNLNGTLLYQQEHVLNNIIDMSGFAPGVYILQIKNDNGITQHRLIVE